MGQFQGVVSVSCRKRAVDTLYYPSCKTKIMRPKHKQHIAGESVEVESVKSMGSLKSVVGCNIKGRGS